jgi:hypothetical protein
MSSTELEVKDEMVQRYEIVERLLKGQNPTVIAREMQIRRVDVLKHIDAYKEAASNDVEIKARAREALMNADNHYNMLIAESWDTIKQVDLGGDYKTKATLLKNIADIEAKRIDFLTKAGLLDDAELGDMVAETEEKLQKIKELLRDTVANCENCRIPVAQGLAVIFQEAAIVVSSEVITQPS